MMRMSLFSVGSRLFSSAASRLCFNLDAADGLLCRNQKNFRSEWSGEFIAGVVVTPR
ncbi:secreted protein [Rhodopirellula sallentina SM41]|uniref:Secreted protein n=1 Tax=Rhodopirellula sallentina SM41 TaxID=1263870 RepID=M5UA91_9BACT|nr:secreted protein [Rhodopirellula sallentina SM41]